MLDNLSGPRTKAAAMAIIAISGPPRPKRLFRAVVETSDDIWAGGWARELDNGTVGDDTTKVERVEIWRMLPTVLVGITKEDTSPKIGARIRREWAIILISVILYQDKSVGWKRFVLKIG